MDTRKASTKQIRRLIGGLALMAAITVPVFFLWSARHPAPLNLSPTVVPQIAGQSSRSSFIAPVRHGEHESEADGDGGWAAKGSIGSPSSDGINPQLTVTPDDRLLEMALDDPDPSVRLSGIEAAIRQRSDEAFDLLWEAVQLDSDPDNRLSAVSELEQMLKRDLFDGESILQLLNETAQDTDPRVAELSLLIVQEHLGGQESIFETAELSVANENDSWQSDSTISESTDIDALPEESLEALLQLALRDPDPNNRLSAVNELEQILKRDLFDGESILQLLNETTQDTDPRVAELSLLIIQEHLSGQESIVETTELPVADENDSWQSYSTNSESNEIDALPEESLETLWQLALRDPDPAVRLGGIEAATDRPDGKSCDLVVQAALYDSDPDNRLSAVGVLENRVKSGFDNDDEILYLLAKTSVDPDPRVAALSELVIEEHLRAREQRSRSENMVSMEE